MAKKFSVATLLQELKRVLESSEFGLAAAAVLMFSGGMALAQALSMRKTNDRKTNDGLKLARTRRRITRLVMRLLANPLPIPEDAPDVAYLYHQMDTNVDSLVEGAISLMQKYPTMPFIVSNVDNSRLKQGIDNGFSGAGLLLEKLRLAGIQGPKISLVEWDYAKFPMIHTLAEAQLVVPYLRQHDHLSVVVVATPFHLPRAAMTLASVAWKGEHPSLHVYTYPGPALDWEEVASHSQGMQNTRYSFLDSEMDRVERYMAQGDLLPPAALESRFAKPKLRDNSSIASVMSRRHA
mmetsp:Transcript_45538/g.97640  ORF Transcript_45538/g.97640 Transcript_45538/m.97640 type:complete len:294 (-) Transcript_45538:211-1092(-)|eukprot:CAMPEP_0206427702 /NCGR_PEP_ID=MMETSP0324_2-20121206/5201_1 /ASSEMBLY_ACC=CAM_ASM_000836 /TAXON_ID=2866 /ORGANISM="Crypthecodinium cohnii, Strain Seligo" /LENGTH=293 /DNA_ID=CAMNT_0053893039 /DNA_START=111 /DNA_END=992 /DNA_ORIENTATION=+